MILQYAAYKDFANEDGTYDEGVVLIIEKYNQLVEKHNQKEYKNLIEKCLLEDKNVHIPHLIEELKNYEKTLFCEKIKSGVTIDLIEEVYNKRSIKKKEVQDGLGNYFTTTTTQ